MTSVIDSLNKDDVRKTDHDLIITRWQDHGVIASYEGGKLSELSFTESLPGDSSDKGKDVLIGDIYIGRVQSIVKNIQAAFVEYLPGHIGYYPLTHNRTHLFTAASKQPDAALTVGDEILVQIERGEIKSKAAVLTSHIQFADEHMVLMYKEGNVGISKKITGERKRERLKSLGERLIAGTELGIVWRTEAAAADAEILTASYKTLLDNHKNIMSTYQKRTCFSRLYRRDDRWFQAVHAKPDDHLRVQTDIRAVYDELISAFGAAANGPVIEYYNDTYPLLKLKSLETGIDRALNKLVWLKSGASVVIEPTEALTAIDVNTSRAEVYKKDKDIFFRINKEAAIEIFRQIRLRNISGMILIDFINMKSREQEDELMILLKQLAAKDPVNCNVIDMTALGLVEITRKRTLRPIHEQISTIRNKQHE